MALHGFPLLALGRFWAHLGVGTRPSVVASDKITSNDIYPAILWTTASATSRPYARRIDVSPVAGRPTHCKRLWVLKPGADLVLILGDDLPAEKE